MVLLLTVDDWYVVENSRTDADAGFDTVLSTFRPAIVLYSPSKLT